MPTGEPGPAGLPGLPGSYTVQVPHNVQKREAGVCSLCAAESLQKSRGLNAHITEPRHLFSLWQFQAVNWLVAARGIAVTLAEANGLKYYWVTSHFIFFFFFIHLTFLVSFSGSAVAKLAGLKRSPQSCHSWKIVGNTLRNFEAFP